MTESGKFEKAFLALHLPRNQGRSMGRAYDTIRFDYNPTEFRLSRVADWRSRASKQPLPPEYAGFTGGTVTLDMFLDASEGGDVQRTVDTVLRAVLPAQGTDTRKKPVAPYVSFGWGSETYVPCAVVRSVVATYKRFNASGAAIRALVTITLEEVMGVRLRQNPTSGAEGIETVHTTQTGDSLASIAAVELGSPSRWRHLADANGIDDPLRLGAGRRLVVPIAGVGG